MDPEEIKRIASRLGRLWTERCNQPQPSGQQQFLQQIRHHAEHVRRYDDWELQEKCRSVIPIDRLHKEAREEMHKHNGLDFEDVVVKRLLQWFKHEFFQWVNQPKCSKCSSIETKMVGYAKPTAQELRGEAGRVEEYECQQCHSRERFPRYGDPSVLLDPENRRGRCGEWANVFALMCRSLGLDTRYVVDWTDHVWTEYYSDRLGKWVHLDSCEAAFDTPLVYESGWGKKLTYCIAFSIDEAVDVSRRYTRDWPAMLQRRQTVSEQVLSGWLAGLNSQLAAQHSNARQDLIRRRRDREQSEWTAAASRTANSQELIGRQSGSTEWRKQRGELGARIINNGRLDVSSNGRLGDVSSASAGSSLQQHAVPLDRLRLMRCLQFTPENTQLNASAKWLRTDSGDHQIQLTPSASDCRGSIWLSVADPDLIDSSRDFAVEFSFRIRRSGADGMALVFHNDPAGTAALGQGGGGLGYAGLTNAIALEIDTYQGVDTCADPNGNHFSLQCAPAGRPLSSHHSQSIACTSDSGVPLPVLNDGSDPLHCLAYYDSAGQTFSVWLSDKPSAGEETTLLCGADYLRILRAEQFLLSERVGNGNRLLIGFTAATGGLSQEHLVLNARVFLQDHLLLS